MKMDKKFNATRFKALMVAEIKARGYATIKEFVDTHKLPRSPLFKAMSGVTVPSRENVNRWCTLLKCTPAKRKEIVTAVYADESDDEDDEPERAA
jgi:phage terminase small subunit